MKKCKFCAEEKGISKIKIRGIKSFCACENCRLIINNTLSKQGDTYDIEVERLEKDLSAPKYLLNIFYILPYYKKQNIICQ